MKWNTLYSGRIDSMGHSDVAEMLKMAERPDVISFAGGLPVSNLQSNLRWMTVQPPDWYNAHRVQ